MLCALLILFLSAAGVELYAQPPLSALRSELPEDAILVANNRIRVPLGRAVFVDPVDDLVVQTRPGDRCTLTVLDGDPFARRPGRLSPEKFPCDFGPGDVTYTHYGAGSPALDRVRLQLRYDAPAETVVIPFVIEVQVDLTQLEVLTKNAPLTVTHLRGTSDAVDGDILDFTYDREGYECRAMRLAGEGALPRYGRLLDGGKLSQAMDCDRLTRADIRYRHTFRGPSPDRDHVPMVLELRDREGNLAKREHFQLTVQIRQGRRNAAPGPSLAATMTMEVSQFALTALTPEMLAADDAEADPGELAFNVTSPLSYEEGYFVSTDDQNLPITSFYQRDLRDLKIAYKPPSPDADSERTFRLEFQAVDPEGAASDPFAFTIVVKPMNSLAPVVTRNAGQLLFEGRSRPLVTGRNLEIGDRDDPEAVRIAAVAGLRHGVLLVRGSRGDGFTAADLAAGAVEYRHDGSDTHSDNVVLEMTDGEHRVDFLFPITVVPTDDEPPVVGVNAGLVLSQRRTMPVTPSALAAADVDSDDSLVRFAVVSPYSALGALLLRQSDAPADPSSWKFDSQDGVYEKEVREWLQKDIAEGRLFYKHVGPPNAITVTDRFVFTVRDDNDPPNESGRATFVIRVLPVDAVPPELHPGTSLQLTVEEFKLTPFSKQVLRYTDSDSEDRDLKYTVSRPPTDTDENHPVAFGSLVLTDRPDVKVSEFTQAEVNRRKIAYCPPAREPGVALRVVQFRYSVEDAAGNRAEGVFTLYLRPISNKPPQIANAGFAVFEGGAHVVARAELDAVGADAEGQSPKGGTVRAAFADLPEKATFRLRDLSEGGISYSHGGGGTASDDFHPDVGDGVHVVGVTVKVRVRPVDDDAPTPGVAALPADGRAPVVGVPEGAKNAIGPRRLNVEAPAEDILCTIDAQPKTGDVEKISPAPGSEKSRSGTTVKIIAADDESPGMQIDNGLGVEDGGDKPTGRRSGADPCRISLEKESYVVDEGLGGGDVFVEVLLRRRGYLGHTSFVGIATRDGSAEEDRDFRAESRGQVRFDPGQTGASWRVRILADGEYERAETFRILLSEPVMAALEFPAAATVEILDPHDESSVFFPEAALWVEEAAGHLLVPVHRGGDVSEELTVLCYTRQGSATGAAPTAVPSHSDFIARPEEAASVLRFGKGEREKACRVRIIDDSQYEPPESFNRTLASPVGGRLGPRYPSARVTIMEDQNDAPVFSFDRDDYHPGQSDAFVHVKVLRAGGDLSKPGAVTVRSRRAQRFSARAGPDHAAFSRDLHFAAGVSALTLRLNVPDRPGRPRPEGAQTFHLLLLVPVNGILGEPAKATISVRHVPLERTGRERVARVEVPSDSAAERAEAFAPYRKPDGDAAAEPRAAAATAYVREANVAFPSRPRVLSLLHYDRPDAAGPQPPAGYPVICVTACNARHPNYEKTGSACVSERIDDTLTRYRWLVGAPAGPAGVAAPMRALDLDTFFTSSKAITLDSIYFQAGSRVQCAARAVNSNGDEGPELSSPIVTVSREEGMCPPRKGATAGAQPFSAKMRYTGADDRPQSNLIKVSVTMPHVDGMLPLISTRPLSNLERTLSPDGNRRGDHRCSNLLDYDEPTAASDDRQRVAGDGPRGPATLRFYRSLRPDACLWEFDAFYRMSQLLGDCGGTMSADGRVPNLVQSYVSVRVPLYVSYVFHSPRGAGGWTHFDLRSQLRLTFVYDTAILWRDGIGSHPRARLHGTLYPSSMRLDRHGRLAVEFRTEARFRGLFVHSRSAGRLRGSGTSTVVSANHPGRTFNLSLLSSEPTFDRPAQQWSFASDFVARDYSGTYAVQLVPCTAGRNAEYSAPPACSPGEAVAFDVAVRFQQVSDPVAVEFSLNANMFLLSQRSAWLSDDDDASFGQESDVTFSEGDTIYGRVMVDPVQNLGGSFNCSIQKVFLCAGADGYVPKYNPTELEFGCLADSPALLYRFKIIDKDQPETQARHFGGVAFNAALASDDPSAARLVRRPGSDGFKLDSGAMFQVASGREWYIHTIYTVRSQDDADRGIEKRRHAINGGDRRRVRRSLPAPLPEAAAGIGSDDTRGTNIIHVALDRFKQPSATGSTSRSSPDGPEAGEPMGDERVDGAAAAVAVAEAFLGVLLLVLTGGILTLASRSGAKCDVGRERGQRDDGWETVKGSLSSEPILVVRMQRSHDGYVV